MAALVEGQQYGLSAQDKINSNKTLVFVKLTDSALRSIEEYVKCRADTTTKPTIKFQSNNGVICLPKKVNKSYSNQTYGFTLSNVEADGPQGSFECLRQTTDRSLDSLGCMHMKMHIHANEDSYEKTRVKMAAVEQENKKFCAKEIKPAGGHIGRKVKVKRPGLSLSPIKSNSPPYSSLQPKYTQKPPNTTTTVNSSSSFVRKPEPQKFQKVAPPPLFRTKHLHSGELMRQTIRDRMIHLLAIRPYKKPELFTKLKSVGVKEKDKKNLSVILSQVAVLKGNAYSLANNLWNEVQDSWKFCTTEETDIIMKRKHQFLSANCENEVPPVAAIQNNSPMQQKRIPSDIAINLDHRNKKQRISHYIRPDTNANYYPTKSGPSEFSKSGEKIQFLPAGAKREPTPLGHEQSSMNGFSPSDDHCQKSPLDSDCKVSFSTLNPENPLYASVVTPAEHMPSGLNQRSCTREENEKNIRNHVSGLSQDCKYVDEKPSSYPMSFVNSELRKPQNPLLSHSQLMFEPSMQVSPDSNYQGNEVNGSQRPLSNGYVNCSNSIKTSYGSRSFTKRSKVTSTTNGSCSTSPHSSSDSRDSMDYNSSDFQVPPPTESSPADYDCPEYVKEYGVIQSNEQRAQYKADFNAQYAEYLDLHTKIKSICKRFAYLENQLHTYEEESEAFKKIREKIYNEYRAYQQDPDYIDALKKLNFLHCKLSHIKSLVMEYDNAHCVRS